MKKYFSIIMKGLLLFVFITPLAYAGITYNSWRLAAEIKVGKNIFEGYTECRFERDVFNNGMVVGKQTYIVRKAGMTQSCSVFDKPGWGRY